LVIGYLLKSTLNKKTNTNIKLNLLPTKNVRILRKISLTSFYVLLSSKWISWNKILLITLSGIGKPHIILNDKIINFMCMPC